MFYFRCKDQPAGKSEADRNTNSESYPFNLIGTQPLIITQVEPANNSVIKGSGNSATIYLRIETDNGYDHGDSTCAYSDTGADDDYIQMFETGTNKHEQRLDLSAGEHEYYLLCGDLGGNADSSQIKFDIEIDNNEPIVVRVYNDANKLKLVTNENSTCSYQTNIDKGCNFQIGEGTNMPYTNSTEHYAEWKLNQNYFVRCMDENGKQPIAQESSAGCSVVVKPIAF